MSTRYVASSVAAVVIATAQAVQPLGASATDHVGTQPHPRAGKTATVQDLAERGSGGFPQYRIPALTTTADGTLIAAYDGRPSMADLPGHISVLVRRSSDGGATWSDPQIVRRGPAPEGYGDPSLLTDRETGRVFVFYAGSVNRGFGNSETGNDNDDPNILHADYSYSDDGGVTWRHRRITSMIKNPAWNGMFAASGEGIQLRHGDHAGRLIQQYTVRYRGGNYAVSAYSDDHGATWQMSELVGPGADENKTVELSDGTVMLNVRSRPHRLVARSTDGGVTYSDLRPDTELVDPANNGSLTRFAPDAPASDPRSKWLLFTNTPDPGIRRNLTVKMSCDDGETWPVKKVVDHGAAGYSTATALGDGRFGLLYEREGYRYLSYAGFDHSWLGGICAPVSVDAPDTLPAGTSDDVTVTVHNQTQARTAPGSLVLQLPAGWSAPETEVPGMAAGGTAEVSVPVTAPADASPTAEITAVYRTRGRESSGSTRLEVTADANAPARSALSVLPVLDHFDAAGAPGLAGDVMTYWTRVTNSGNTTLTDVTVTGNMDNLPSCHYSSLAPGQSYVCRTGRATLTEAAMDRGFYTPRLRVSGSAPDGTRASAQGTGDRLDLR